MARPTEALGIADAEKSEGWYYDLFQGMLSMPVLTPQPPTIERTVLGIVRCMRPAQWLKNGFVFAPALFAGQIFELATLVRVGLAFALFSLVAGAVYLLNDAVDAEADRLHPQKRLRPIAVGDLSARTAYLVMIALMVFGLAAGYLLAPAFAVVLLAYFALNVMYSLHLKHQVILDVLVIAAGFVLRVEGGAVAAGVASSTWLLVCTSTLALFLGFSKRRHELTLPSHETRRVLAEYSERFLDQMMSLVTGLVVISYLMYTLAPETLATFGRGMLLTFPFVLYGVFRYQYLVYHRNEASNPTDTLLTDRPLLVTVALWGITAGLVVAMR